MNFRLRKWDVADSPTHTHMKTGKAFLAAIANDNPVKAFAIEVK